MIPITLLRVIVSTSGKCEKNFHAKYKHLTIASLGFDRAIQFPTNVRLELVCEVLFLYDLTEPHKLHPKLHISKLVNMETNFPTI